MLVLTRKLNEKITIGHSEITVTVVDVKGGRVRLGIEAPKEIRIERLESHPVGHAADVEVEPSHAAN